MFRSRKKNSNFEGLGLIWTGRRRNALKGFRGHETGVEGMAEKENVLEWVNALIT